MENVMEASVRLLGGLKFECTADGQPPIYTDHPIPPAAAEGYAPLNLLLISLMTCSGGTAAALLRKFRKDVAGFSVSARGTLREMPRPSLRSGPAWGADPNQQSSISHHPFLPPRLQTLPMSLFKSAINKLKQGLARTRTGSAATVRTILTGKALSPELLKQLERAMIQADIGIRASIEIRKDIQAAFERGEITSGDQALQFLKDQLTAYYPATDRSLKFAPPGTGPTVILVAGINGAGKTTSIAKITKSLRDEGKSVMLAACDTFRAAAVEQLEVWSQRLGVQVIKGQQGGDPAAVAFDAAQAARSRGIDVLVLDTAGRLHTQDHLMRQLTKIRSVVAKQIPGAPHEVILVIDATTGQNGINQAKVFAEATDVTGIFLSKLDGTARGGIVIAIREELNLPVKFIGVGETPDDVEPFDPAKFVDAMFAE